MAYGRKRSFSQRRHSSIKRSFRRAFGNGIKFRKGWNKTRRVGYRKRGRNVRGRRRVSRKPSKKTKSSQIRAIVASSYPYKFGTTNSVRFVSTVLNSQLWGVIPGYTVGPTPSDLVTSVTELESASPVPQSNISQMVRTNYRMEILLQNTSNAPLTVFPYELTARSSVMSNTTMGVSIGSFLTYANSLTGASTGSNYLEFSPYDVPMICHYFHIRPMKKRILQASKVLKMSFKQRDVIYDFTKEATEDLIFDKGFKMVIFRCQGTPAYDGSHSKVGMLTPALNCVYVDKWHCYAVANAAAQYSHTNNLDPTFVPADGTIYTNVLPEAFIYS